MRGESNSIKIMGRYKAKVLTPTKRDVMWFIWRWMLFWDSSQMDWLGRVGAHTVSRRLFIAAARGSCPGQVRSGYMGFVVDEVALSQVFSEHFGFPCHSFHWLFNTHHHPSSGAGTAGQWATHQIDLVSPPHQKKKKDGLVASNVSLPSIKLPFASSSGPHNSVFLLYVV
jgi:hypothetical protein